MTLDVSVAAQPAAFFFERLSGRMAGMDPKDRELLEKTFNLAEENNHLLRSMRRSMRFSQAFRIVYWLLIIGASVGAYYVIQPYIDQLLEVYSGFSTDYSNIQGALKSFGG